MPHGARVEVRGLEFAWERGGFSLRVPELVLEPGEALACIGPSGSGKSTLLQLLAGILTPARGEVVLDGRAWSAAGEAQRRRRRLCEVGLVFQEFELLDHLSVLENVLLPYHLGPALILDAGARDAAEELARAAGLWALLARKPRALSHGERQRVALCRALVARPRLVLADEPTGNLDPATATRVVELLLARRGGATLLVVTHDHGLLGRFDRVLDLEHAGGAGA